MKYLAKIYGLERSGTNYLEWLLSNNFEDLLVATQWLGWKHGEIDPTVQRVVNGGLSAIGPEDHAKIVPRHPTNDTARRQHILSLVDQRKILFFFVVRNPYTWYLSFSRFYKFPSHPVWNSVIDRWNRNNRKWRAFADHNKTISYIVKYEDLIDRRIDCLKEIESRFHLVASKPYVDINVRIKSGLRLSGQQFKPMINNLEGCLRHYRQSDLSAMASRIDRDLLKQFSYDIPCQAQNLIFETGENSSTIVSNPDSSCKAVKRKIIVSLTTIKSRMRLLPKVLESICCQSCAADEINLFLSSEPYLLDEGITKIPGPIDRFIRNGKVVVHFVPNTGSYRKLIPILEKYWEKDVLILTVDDDTIYPVDFIQRMVDAYEKCKCIIACRGKQLTRLASGEVAPYSRWKRIKEPFDVHLLNFPVGKDGILYHPTFFTDRVFDPKSQEICTYADDIWFRANSWLKEVPTCVLCVQFPEIKRYPVRRLWRINRSLNDVQLRQTVNYLNIPFFYPQSL